MGATQSTDNSSNVLNKEELLAYREKKQKEEKSDICSRCPSMSRKILTRFGRIQRTAYNNQSWKVNYEIPFVDTEDQGVLQLINAQLILLLLEEIGEDYNVQITGTNPIEIEFSLKQPQIANAETATTGATAALMAVKEETKETVSSSSSDEEVAKVVKKKHVTSSVSSSDSTSD